MPTIWPLGLPQRVLRDGFDEAPPRLAVRTPMDTGAAKLRRRSTNGPRPVKAVVRVSVAQRAILDDFYLTTLAGGTLRFDWTHPVTGAAASFRFVSPPSYRAAAGIKFNATLDLEIVP